MDNGIDANRKLRDGIYETERKARNDINSMNQWERKGIERLGNGINRIESLGMGLMEIGRLRTGLMAIERLRMGLTGIERLRMELMEKEKKGNKIIKNKNDWE